MVELVETTAARAWSAAIRPTEAAKTESARSAAAVGVSPRRVATCAHTIRSAAVRACSSSIVAQQHAVFAGCGIGLLHHFSAGSDDQLIPVLPNLSVLRTYWVLFHARQEKVARIRAVISFLEDIVKFDGGAIDVSNAD